VAGEQNQGQQGGQQSGGQSSSSGASQSQSQQGGVQQGGSQQTNQSQERTRNQNEGGQQQQQAAQRPEWVPEQYFDPAKGEIKGVDLRKHFDELTAFKAADDSRRLNLPKSPDDFKPEFSKDFKPPEGIAAPVIDDKNPLWAQAKQFMFDVQTGKVSGQEAFSKMADLYAGAMVSDQQTIKNARDGEIAKLGTTGPARITAVQTWLRAQFGDELGRMIGGDEKTMGRIFTAKDVEFWEKAISKFTSQGAGNFTQQHRDHTSETLTDEQYNALTPRQQFEYAQKHKKAAA
jgi:hypothetical protein